MRFSTSFGQELQNVFYFLLECVKKGKGQYSTPPTLETSVVGRKTVRVQSPNPTLSFRFQDARVETQDVRTLKNSYVPSSEVGFDSWKNHLQ